MNTILTFIGTYILFAVWQSTLWLAAALILGRFYSRTPWKAHFLYVTGIFAATLTPLLSVVVFATSGGMLKISAVQFSVGQWVNPQLPGLLHLAGMTLFVAVLSYGIATSRRLMFHASPFPDKESQETLLRHSKALRNISLPVLFTSPSVKSPTVWCWGLHPAVLLPESLAEKLRDVERDAVFLHELSHIIRRDHLTALLSRLCGIVLFWNPLYWLALWQSDFAADQSCDRLVLTQGNIPPEQYKDTLLRLVAGERARPILQFLSRKERIMKRIDQIMNFVHLPAASGSQRWTALIFTISLLLCVTLAFCQEGKVSPEKGMMMGYVENFFNHNARDITMRKSLEWGEVQTDGEGNRTIRYKFEALIWDKDRIIFCSDFTFDKDGNYVSMVHVEGFPQPAEKPDVTTLEGVQKLVEKFFSQNFRDITARKTISWGELEKHADGSVSLVYRYEAAIWDREIILDERRFTFDKDGNVKSWERTKGFPQEIDSPGTAQSETGVPVVIRMEPANGATDVDAQAVKELRVTFDIDMNTGGYSWTGGGPMYPKIPDGMRPRWIDKRTCVLPVELEPGKNYRLGINAPSFQNFQSESGVPVVPVVCTFATTALANPGTARSTALSSAPYTTLEGGYTHLVLFTGSGDFVPRSPQGLLNKLNAVLLNTRVRTGYFRTWPENNRLIGGICTDDATGLMKVIELIPDLELISTEPLSEQSFTQHADKTQESLPDAAMKDFEKDAKPLPEGLLQSIQEKRRAIQSAEYSVRWLDDTGSRKTEFRFQGKNRWFADISEIMQSSVFQTGCDGQTEWGFSNSSRGDIRYTTRNLADIKEFYLSFLDPFGFLNESEESLEERLQKQGIRYYGEEEIAGKKRYLFGRMSRDDDERRTSTTLTEIALIAETLLPATVRTQHDFSFVMGDDTMSRSMKTTLIYDIVSINEQFPDSAFLPDKTEGTEPILQEKPDEGYDTFFVRIDDGSGGRMSVRLGGQRGEKEGMIFSGLN